MATTAVGAALGTSTSGRAQSLNVNVATYGELFTALNQANAQFTSGAPHVINITANIALPAGSADFGVLALPPVFNSVTINGNGHTIDAQNQSRIFFIGVDETTRAGAAVAGSIVAQRPQVTISDLTLANGRAAGGASGIGGGGMGAGGALFVNASADVRLRNVALSGNAAAGGGSLGLGAPIPNAAGGGGLGGAGGSGGGGGLGGSGGLGEVSGGGGIGGAGGNATVGFGGGGGGGGYTGNGGVGGGGPGDPGVQSIAGLSSGGAVGGGMAGGAGGTNGGGGGGGNLGAGFSLPGGGGGFNPGGNENGGFGGGGGGGASDGSAVIPQSGGAGGFGGGGGGGPVVLSGGFGGGGGGTRLVSTSTTGGFGGFGGGGGASTQGPGGLGGFGGGGGGGSTAGGSGGFGGGNGTLGGGGGAALGGAVFVVQGGSLVIEGSGTTSGGSVTGGIGANNGAALGSGFFLQGNGTLDFNPGTGQTQTISDVIADQSGSGGTGANAGNWSLTKSGAGTLELAAINNFSGGVTVAEGTLRLLASGAAGSGAITTTGSVISYGNGVTVANPIVVNSSTTQLEVLGADAATQAGVISETGGARPIEKIGAGALTLTAANTYTGGTTVSAGTLRLGAGGSLAAASALTVAAGASFDLGGQTQTLGALAGSGALTLGAGALTAGGGNASSTFGGIISGAGSLTKTGSGSLTFAGNNTYSGATVVNGGALLVNGSVAPSSGVTINSGGIVGGTGTLAATTVNNGGTLAPGNSIGTVTVNGNLTFNAGSIYAVEVSSSAADRTNVTGTATLTGGTVQATMLSGSFRPRSFVILNAGSIVGTFAGLTVIGNATNPILTYDPNNVFLSFAADSIVLAPSLNRNQRNVGDTINNTAPNATTAAFDTLPAMTGPTLANALDQLTGQVATGAPAAAIQSMNAFLPLILNPFGGAPDGNPGALGYARALGAAEPAPLPKEAADAFAAVMPARAERENFDRRWSLWGAGYGGRNTVDGDAAVAGSHDLAASTWGFAGGADYRATRDLTMGFALAGGGSNWSLAQGLGSGKSDNFHAGVHASQRFGATYVTAALAYGWHGVTTDRSITLAGTETLRARFHAHDFAGRVETGHRIPTVLLDVTPYAALQAQNVRTPSYVENATAGSGAFALRYQSQSTTALRTELGAWLVRSLAIGAGQDLTLRARAAWAHDGGRDRRIAAAFLTLPGSAFTVDGAEPPANLALVSAGGELRIDQRLSLTARFDGEFANSARTYSGLGTVRYSW